MVINISKKEEDVNVVDKTSPKTSVATESSAKVGRSCDIGFRHLQALLMFLGMTLGYSLRVGMSVAIVPMMNASTANPDIKDYGWDNKDKSLVLSSFFWGYTVGQVPSGYIAGVWSARSLLSIGMLLCGIFNVITPLVTDYWDLLATCVCRVGMGVTQACLLPCVHTLLSKWAPPSERARLATFSYAGAQFGTVLALPIAGILAGSSIGWPSIFYLFGALAIIWSVLFFFFAADSPAKHKHISQEEKEYVEESLRTSSKKEDDEVQQKLRTPWKEILTSAPMWAIIIAHCGQNWGYWTLLTEMPSYMKKVLNFNIEGSGGYAALPYLAMWILSFPVSWLSDYVLKKGVSRTVVRKVSNTMAFWGPAIALACMSVVPENDFKGFWALILLIIAVGLNAGSLCGFQVNHLDLSSNYAGTMMSITNCIASVIAIIAPLICDQVIVSDESNVYQWNIVFYVSAAIYFLSNLVFVIYGKGDVQWWNNPELVKLCHQIQKGRIDVIETKDLRDAYIPNRDDTSF